MAQYKTLGLNLPSDWHDLARTAIGQGWKLSKTRGQHVRWQPPQGAGRAVFTGSTPSDWRAIKNTRTKLRRMGLKV